MWRKESFKLEILSKPKIEIKAPRIPPDMEHIHV